MADKGATAKRLRIIVIQDDSEDIESLSNEIKSKYPNHYQFSEKAFVIVTSDLPSEISRTLMSYGKEDQRSAGVFDTNALGIAGYVDGDFWEWLTSAHMTIESNGA